MKFLILFLFASMILGAIEKPKIEKSKSLNKKVFKNASKPKEIKENCSNGMCSIPEGIFTMGCNKSIYDECETIEKPAHKVYLDAFKIDQYEVTVKEFRKCVNAGKCSKSNFKTNAKNSYNNYGNSSRDNHPMNAVNWYGAKEYCTYMDKRLPTEAEWEKAAKGIGDNIYSWGNEKATCFYTVMDSGEKHGLSGCKKGSTWQVGSKIYGKNDYGLYDMSGNVWEWVNDYLGLNYYKTSPIINPKGPIKSPVHVLRGGGWISGYVDMRLSIRNADTADYISNENGFRCAKSENIFSIQ